MRSEYTAPNETKHTNKLIALQYFEIVNKSSEGVFFVSIEFAKNKHFKQLYERKTAHRNPFEATVRYKSTPFV